MSRAPIAADIRRFILTSVPSVPYLEAALLLRAEPGAAWTPPELARRLYIGERPAAELLQALSEAQVAKEVEGQPGWRYAPDAPLAQLIDGLASAYSDDLVAVTDLIHSRRDKRAQQFADAFRFRKE